MCRAARGERCAVMCLSLWRGLTSNHKIMVSGHPASSHYALESVPPSGRFDAATSIPFSWIDWSFYAVCAGSRRGCYGMRCIGIFTLFFLLVACHQMSWFQDRSGQIAAWFTALALAIRAPQSSFVRRHFLRTNTD
jgi:hypothetical protein